MLILLIYQLSVCVQEYKLLYPTLAKKTQQRKEKEKQSLMDDFEEVNVNISVS